MVNHRFPSRGFPLLAALLAAAVLAVLACSSDPPAPLFDNPLDPDGAQHGDPFQVQALVTDDAVLVTWQDPGLENIAGYEVLRSLVRDGTYEVIGSSLATMFQDTTFVPDAVNYYKVRALDGNGVPTAVSLVTPAAVAVPPVVRTTPAGETAVRVIGILVRSSVGDSAAVDSTTAFSSAVGATFADGDTVRLTWDLGPADSCGVVKRFYVRVFAGGVPTATVAESLTVAFHPALHLAGDPATVGRRRLDLVITGDGITTMRFAPDRNSLAGATWQPAATSYGDYVLAASLDSQIVYGEFRGEFGFSVVESLTVVPDDLTGVTFTINGGAEATSDTTLALRCSAAATEMRYAETPAALAATPWEPFSDTATLTHSGCAGDLYKTVYGQFRNDFVAASEPVSAGIQWLPPEVLTVTLSVPDTVTGGTTVTITGTARRGTCDDPLDTVELDTGDGWQVVEGLTEWSRDWLPPVVTADSTVTLQARVLAGAAAATTSADVVITP